MFWGTLSLKCVFKSNSYFVFFTAIFLLCSLLLTENPAFAQTEAYMYRYQTESGEKIVGYQVPASSVQYGYEILNKRLRTIKVVEPRMSDERLEEVKQQQLKDEEEARLLKLYASSADAERTRDKKVSALDVIIKITQSNIDRLNFDYKTFASQAANIEKRGEEVPAHIQTNIDSVVRQIADAEKFKKSKQSEVAAIYEEYKDDIQKLKEIEAKNKTASSK